MKSGAALPFPPVAFPFFFVGTWLAICYILSLASGWQLLARRFRADAPELELVLAFRSATMRGVNYNNVLTLGANHAGLYLSPFFLFKPGSPALFIPWSEVRVGERKRHLFGMQQLTLHLGQEEDVSLTVRLGLAEQLLANASDPRLHLAPGA